VTRRRLYTGVVVRCAIGDVTIKRPSTKRHGQRSVLQLPPALTDWQCCTTADAPARAATTSTIAATAVGYAVSWLSRMQTAHAASDPR
jgi:hypothetical protein